ncbi:MAG: integrase arm-type DNA-binding domain-containing protein [Rhodocyclaceae bacterium]|nr:integrase arm-type DNA-binding domain-containing protein [Rhodocyclaceae bacterium]
MLTDNEIKNAQPRDKAYRLSDGAGLHLEVSPAGGKLWRLRYRFGGKEKVLALGKYPNVRGPEARKRAAEARQAIEEGIDPAAERKAAKERTRVAGDGSFEAVARTWVAKVAPTLTQNTQSKHLAILERDVFPWLGTRQIAELSAPDLITVLRRIEGRGALDIAKRAHNLCGRIFRFGVGHGMCDRDPSRDIELRDVLPAPSVRHHASITDPKEVGALLRAIDGFTGSFVTRTALRLAPLVFVRPGELRHAEWLEFDLERAEWRIPAAKMKMNEQHIVPLSRQAISILTEIQPLTGHGRYVFPGECSRARPMSENTANAALRRMGYSKQEMTGHGFRSTASTLLHELGYPHAVIERQLAHGERNKVSASYNFAEYLPERRTMMQEWATYLDGLNRPVRNT